MRAQGVFVKYEVRFMITASTRIIVLRSYTDCYLVRNRIFHSSTYMRFRYIYRYAIFGGKGKDLSWVALLPVDVDQLH